MKRILFFLSLAAVFAACQNTDKTAPVQTPQILNHTPYAPRPDLDTAQVFQEQYNLARKDLMIRKAKYYYFGIVSASQHFIDSMHQNYGIEVISPGCTVDSMKAAYNRIVDSFLYKLHAKKK